MVFFLFIFEIYYDYIISGRSDYVIMRSYMNLVRAICYSVRLCLYRNENGSF